MKMTAAKSGRSTRASTPLRPCVHSRTYMYVYVVVPDLRAGHRRCYSAGSVVAVPSLPGPVGSCGSSQVLPVCPGCAHLAGAHLFRRRRPVVAVLSSPSRRRRPVVAVPLSRRSVVTVPSSPGPVWSCRLVKLG